MNYDQHNRLNLQFNHCLILKGTVPTQWILDMTNSFYGAFPDETGFLLNSMRFSISLMTSKWCFITMNLLLPCKEMICCKHDRITYVHQSECVYCVDSYEIYLQNSSDTENRKMVLCDSSCAGSEVLVVYMSCDIQRKEMI